MHVTHLYINDNKLYSTDGKRLYIVDLTDYALSTLPERFYQVVKRTKSEMIIQKIESGEDYPNVNDIIESFEDGLKDGEEINFEYKSIQSGIAQTIRAMHEKVSIDTNYINDLFLGLEDYIVTTIVNKYDKAMPVKVIYDSRITAYIMPMIIK